jgi:hypothetical protein
MTTYEIISIVISIFALAISIIAIIKSSSLSAQGNTLTMGQVELQINERISETKKRVGEIAMQIVPIASKRELTDEDKVVLETYNKIFKSAVEDNLNAYEEACGKYRDDGKVDKERFKKMYKTQIRQLVENKDYEEYFHPITSRFKCILTVYEEWENLEKINK